MISGSCLIGVMSNWSRPPLLMVKIWDDDLQDDDDPLATADVRLVAKKGAVQDKRRSSGSMEVKLTGIGRGNKGCKISFDWERVDDGEDD